MHLYHLSHIDLDGYGCQFVSKEFFKNCHFYNANYGNEIRVKLSQIIKDIKEHNYRKIFILISDINLSILEAIYINEEVVALVELGKEIKLVLLDHHISGTSTKELFCWYHLDNNRCATKMVFDYMMENFIKPSPHKTQKLKKFVSVVNSIDLWLEGEEFFEFGKVCMRFIMESKEINRFMFDKEHREYKFYILNSIFRYINKKNNNVKLDDAFLKIKKSYLSIGDDHDTIDNLSSKHLGKLLNQKAEECFIYYRGKKGFLSYNIGSISTLANDFLKSNTNFDFFMDVSQGGKCSLRSNGKADVSEIAKELFGGGGHKNASGGRVDSFKESFVYSEVKSIIESLIKEKERCYGNT